MLDIIDYDDGVSALDSGLGRPRLTAIHLVVEGGHAAIVDTGSTRSVPRVLEALAQKGVPPENVDYVVLTHVHLDHAGGAGALMRRFPNARLTVHPRGVRHMVDPSRLVEGTVAVYGADHMERVHGPVVPVPQERVLETPHGARIDLQGRQLAFLDTPGHARHHVCIWDAKARAVFAGDTFGIAYSELDDGEARYILPTTSPTQFDPDAAHRSIDDIMALEPRFVYVTHYGQVRDVAKRSADLHRLIDAHAELALDARGASDRLERLRAGVRKLVLDEVERRNWDARRAEVLDLMRDDIELNALGLACWLDAMP